MPGRPEHPQPLQPAAQLRAGLAVFRRQPITKRPVREPKIGTARPAPDRQARGAQDSPAPPGTPAASARRSRPPAPAARAHPRSAKRRGQPPHRRARPRRPLTPARSNAVAQQLDRVTERHALGAHHPVDHRPARLARPHAMPQILRRRDHQRRRALLVKRTAAHQVLALRGAAPPPPAPPAAAATPPPSAARSRSSGIRAMPSSAAISQNSVKT